MANYYCDASKADDTGDGTTPSTAKKTFAAGTALLSASGGDTLFLKKGSYSLTGNVAVPTGTLGEQNQIIGYNTAIGDLTDESTGTWAATHLASGLLDTTNFPSIAFGASLLTLGSYTLLAGVNITGSRNGPLVNISNNRGDIIFRSSINNTNTGSSATAIACSLPMIACDCDLFATTASGGYVCGTNSSAILLACRISSPNGGGISLNVGTPIVRSCVFYNLPSGQDAITLTHVFASTIIDSNTFYNVAGVCINHTATSSGPIIGIMNNQATGCGTFAKSSTTSCFLFGGHNRLRNNTTNYTGWANNGGLPGDITSADTDTSEYVSIASNNYWLNPSAVGKGTGIPPYLDIGAWQRQESSLPPFSSSIGG